MITYRANLAVQPAAVSVAEPLTGLQYPDEGGGGGPSGDGLLLEHVASSYLLLESGDYLLLE